MTEELTQEAFRSLIEESQGRLAIFICGPSGSGKNTIETIIRTWIDACQKEGEMKDFVFISNAQTKGKGEEKHTIWMQYINDAISRDMRVFFNTRGNHPDSMAAMRESLQEAGYLVIALVPCVSVEVVKERMRARDQDKVDELQIEQRYEQGEVALQHLYEERTAYDGVFFINNEQTRATSLLKKDTSLSMLARFTKGHKYVYAEEQFSQFITRIEKQKTEKLETQVTVTAARL